MSATGAFATTFSPISEHAFAKRIALRKEAEHVEREIIALLAAVGVPLDTANRYLEEVAQAAEEKQQALRKMYRQTADTQCY